MGKVKSSTKRRRCESAEAESLATVLAGGISAMLSQSSSESYMDLFVPLPRGDTSAAGLSVNQLLDRFRATGFSHVALTHTVYGPPKPADDSVSRIRNAPNHNRKSKASPSVLYRLHAVVENLSDVGLYVNQINDSSLLATRPIDEIMKEYDIISISPRNDAVFQQACSTATAAEIITLDYAASRGQLPFKITRSDVKAAMARNAVFEIPVAAACLNRNLRKGLIQTCRMLQSASLGLKPRVIVSSGERFIGTDKKDTGVLALRMPGDLINLANAVLGWDTQSAIAALSTNAAFVIDQGRRRRFGESLVVDVALQDLKVIQDTKRSVKAVPKASGHECVDRSLESDHTAAGKVRNGDAQAGEDGFISF